MDLPVRLNSDFCTMSWIGSMHKQSQTTLNVMYIDISKMFDVATMNIPRLLQHLTPFSQDAGRASIHNNMEEKRHKGSWYCATFRPLSVKKNDICDEMENLYQPTERV